MYKNNFTLISHTIRICCRDSSKRQKVRNTLQKQKGCFNPAWLPQLQLHCQAMYLQADKLTTTSLKFQAER